ncbi:hypothetical protein CP02DC21_0711A, partial [Chlamydia psittaci 02DC21]
MTALIVTVLLEVCDVTLAGATPPPPP